MRARRAEILARFNAPVRRQSHTDDAGKNCAFSAGGLALHEPPGRCPRLLMNAAFGAKQIRETPPPSRWRLTQTRYKASVHGIAAAASETQPRRKFSSNPKPSPYGLGAPGIVLGRVTK